MSRPEEHNPHPDAMIIPQMKREVIPKRRKHWMAKTIVRELGDIVLTARHSKNYHKKKVKQSLPSGWISIEEAKP
tara:strand:- start:583 stop:807 length:225 start_codon:yes stop_codon:yes gene_type:complete